MSRLKKSKLTKNIWYDGDRYKVLQLISPNAHQDFLLLEYATNMVNEDGFRSVSLIVLDVHNDPFLPDTKKVRALMSRYEHRQLDSEKDKRMLDAIWLDLFKD